jgi:hypothetical protein
MRNVNDFIAEAEPLGETGSANRAFNLAEWLKRKLPKPDYLLGNLLCTTSRILLYAPTGLGKTMFGMGLSMAAANGNGFLHWEGIRTARVLFIDGEMPRELLQERLQSESERLGAVPENFTALSKEDCDAMGPLNTPEGQQFIDRIIDSDGGKDLVVLDNIMSLLSGNQKDEESWHQTLPWIRSLTKRRVGQFWIHHTGHDASHSYGTKTREWQMDTVMRLEKVERPDTDISFLLSFRDKVRRRTPANRSQFDDTRIALVENHWVYQRVQGRSKTEVSPLAKKFYEALMTATKAKEVAKDLLGDPFVSNKSAEMFGCPAATIEQWQRECARMGLIDAHDSRGHLNNKARSLYSKYRLILIEANWIACNETMAWVLPI